MAGPNVCGLTAVLCCWLGIVPVVHPLRGWNSWDAYKQLLNESSPLVVAENMAKPLLPYGYDTLVIDGGWSDAYNHEDRTDCIDAYRRPQPNLQKWPSTAGDH